MSQLAKFFNKLSERKYKENDLSDVTWALCESCPEFKHTFLTFFFPHRTDFSTAFLVREFTYGNCRPDFYFEIENETFVIEVKKYDMVDHFEEYRNVVKPTHFGWIANYPVRKAPDYVNTRTWRAFAETVSALVNHNKLQWDDEVISLITGYHSYLSKVCNIINLKKMNLAEISNLYHFNILLEEIVSSNRTELECEIYKGSNPHTRERNGVYFTIAKDDDAKNWVTPWFGIYFNEDPPIVCIGFGKNDCNSVYEGLRTIPAQKGQLFEEWYDDREGTFWFHLTPMKFNEFNQATDVNQQRDILSAYFQEVLSVVKQFL